MRRTKLQTMLKNLNACGAGIDWADGHGLRKAWDTCERSDWMLWLCGKLEIDQKLMVAIACKCARTALIYVPKTEKRPLEAIKTAERWLKGKATRGECRAAADAAYAAADAAYAAAYAADAAAYAAADAAYAAYAAAYAAADAAYARAKARKRQCVIVRGIVPYSVVYKAAKAKGLI